MNPDKIRNVLNILFLILALASIIVYIVAMGRLQTVYIRLRRSYICKAYGDFSYGSPTDKEK